MAEMIPFIHRGFRDVPRHIFLRYRNTFLLLHSEFDEQQDEYSDAYSVYALPSSAENSIRERAWKALDDGESLTYLGEIQVKDVSFDPSKRKELDPACLKPLMVQLDQESI
jgi:hypothetical protein